MRIDVATLFPEMCEAVLSESILGRARKKGCLDVNCWNIRDYTLDKHRRVDDVPYGGGRGMVMQADPIYRCYEAVCAQAQSVPHRIYMSPKGAVLTQQRALELMTAGAKTSSSKICVKSNADSLTRNSCWHWQSRCLRRITENIW